MCSLIGVNERERSKMGIDFEEPQKIQKEKRDIERERERESERESEGEIRVDSVFSKWCVAPN